MVSLPGDFFDKFFFVYVYLRHMRIEREYGPPSTTYLPGDDATAIALADGGDLMTVSDICDAMLADDRVCGALKTRAFGVTSLNRTDSLGFEPGLLQSSDAMLAIGEDWWLTMSEGELARLIMFGSLVGIVPVQRIPLDNKGRTVYRMRVWSPRWLSVVDGEWCIETTDGKVSLGDEFVLYSISESRPWAFGAWRSCYVWWLVKQFAIRDWARFSELFGSGAIIGILPSGVSSEDPEAVRFRADIRSLGRNIRMVMPAGYEIKMAGATNATLGAYPFSDQVQAANTAISIAILGQPLTTEVANAIQTGATAASLVREDYRRADCEAISTFSRSFLELWALDNFGAREYAPYVRYDAVLTRESRRSQRVFQLSALGDALGKLAVIPGVDLAAILDEFEVPRRHVQIQASGEAADPEGWSQPVFERRHPI